MMPESLLSQLSETGKCASIWRQNSKAQGEASLWTMAGDGYVRRGLFNAKSQR